MTTTADRVARETPVESAVELARTYVLDARRLLQDWTARRDDAVAEFERLRDRSGVAALDDPDSAGDVARQMFELNESIGIADRALAAQRPRVDAAERAYLEAMLAVLDAEVAQHQAVLDKHERKTAQLLRDLEAHEGPYVPESLYLRARASGGPATTIVDGFSPSRRTPASAPIRAAVDKAVQSARVVRMLLAGEDAEALLTEMNVQRTVVTAEAFYPAFVWGPDALVPAPAWRARVDRARARVAEIEGAIVSAADYLASASPTLPTDRGVGDERPNNTYEMRQQVAEELPDQLERARAELAALTGLARDTVGSPTNTPATRLDSSTPTTNARPATAAQIGA